MKKSTVAILLGVGVVGFGLLKSYNDSNANTSLVDVILSKFYLSGALIMGTSASGMTISPEGLAAIAQREGYASRKYPDPAGQTKTYSIGYGHQIKITESYTQIDESKARELLARDTKTASDAVSAYVRVGISQTQFDALTSFAFNVGIGAFKKSTLLSLLNAGDVAGAAAQFDRWHTPAIVISRRDGEKAQFLA